MEKNDACTDAWSFTGDSLTAGESGNPTTAANSLKIILSSELTYKMDYKDRGIFLIVDMIDDDSSKNEVRYLEQYALLLGFKKYIVIKTIKSKEDCEDLKNQLKEAGKSSHRNYDCFMLVLIAYPMREGKGFGCYEKLTGDREDIQLKLKELMEPFTGSEAPTLCNKPKIFLIHSPEKLSGTEASTDSTPDEQSITIPNHCDFFIAAARPKEQEAYIDGKCSKFVATLSKVMKNFRDLDICKQMAIVNRELRAGDYPNKDPAFFFFRSQLTKTLVFKDKKI